MLVNGLILGANYALMALGITLIFAILGILNFAHGQMYVLGGFVTYYLYGVFGLHYLLALPAAAATVALVGIVFERLCFRPVLRTTTREESTMLLAAGTALLLDSVALVVFGEKQRGVPPIVPGVYQVFGAFVPAGRVVIFGFALALIGAFLLFMQYTRPGRALRAVAQDREAAALMGVSIDRYFTLGFAVGAALAGVAGALLVTLFAVNAGAGTSVSIKAFIMIMLGGAGVVSGAIVGAFALGFAEAVGYFLLPGSTTYLLILLALILFLLFRPHGIMGRPWG